VKGAVVFAVVVGAVAVLTAQRPTFKTGIDLVNFGVSVVQKGGQPVTDLAHEDFEIYEDGQKQTVKYFAPGDGGEQAPDLHLGLLLDTSGSMEEDIKLARTAAIKFLNTLPYAADITLVDFDTEVRVARYGQADFARLVERIRGRKTEGYTALYDALGVYLDGANGLEGRKILVLYTDGGDNSSNISFGDTLTLLRASDVAVYAIGLLEHQLTSVKLELRMRLQQMAEETGGLAFFPSSVKDLDGVYDKVQADIKGQYTLGYVSTNDRADGTWRKVEIRVNRAGPKNWKIRTRKGYFAPYKPPSR
jgi:Ca-activated chloride channel family protein